MSDYSLRDQLIDSGALRPGPGLTLPAVRLPTGTPVLRLDDTGRVAARTHIRQGRNGALIMRVAWDSR